MTRETHAIGRRQFAKLGASALGIAGLGGITAAESTDRFIVKRAAAGGVDGEVVYDLSEVGYLVVRSSESRLEGSAGVDSFAPDTEFSFTNEPVERRDAEQSATDEPYYQLQWDKQDLDVPTAHETTRGEGTRVAIIDTGVDAGHPDLEVNTDLSKNFTDDDYGAGGPYGGYHGTHVAGIVGAETDNEVGVAGTAPATELVDFRVFSPGTLASFSDMVAAIVESARVDCDAANLSLGAYPIARQGLGSFYGSFVNRTVTWANSQGTLVVVAAGNDAADLQHDGPVISLPNEAARALSVSATGPIGFGWGDDGFEAPPESPASYTNHGTNAVDIAAPGGDFDAEAVDGVPGWYYDLVLSTISTPVFDGDEYLGSTAGYGWAAGTSMAAPQVAGAAALVKSNNPDYNANEVRSALEGAAEVPDGYDKAYYGSGYLNVLDAL